MSELVKRSKDGEITFRDEDHSYTDSEGNKYISVTTIVGNLFDPFNSKEVAKKKADWQKVLNGRKYKKGEEITELEKRMATQKYWLNEWEEAAEHGSRVHLALENYVEDNEDISHLTEERDHKKYKQGVEFINWFFYEHLKAKDVKFETEIIIYNKEHMISGQIDLMAIADGVCYLLDYKTSKKISMEGYKGKKGTSPITAHLDSCEYIKYSIQLGIYRRMKELQGEEIDSCYIIHLMEDDFQTFKAKELDSVIDAIFEERKQEITKALNSSESQLTLK